MGTDDEHALVVAEEAEGLIERNGTAGRGGAQLGPGGDRRDEQNETGEAANQVAQTSSQGSERRETNGNGPRAWNPQRTGAAPSGVWRRDSRSSG
jgi:hypothetical protein